jgi:hypothetical protein
MNSKPRTQSGVNAGLKLPGVVMGTRGAQCLTLRARVIYFMGRMPNAKKQA